ncbi:hypothetical protein L210DRAFT_384715 [Boletus edulis BED1]|uniref:Uncharacterized protein n=1 Tax=Boletus edulis BED1 TaxID=1328754 RepID=A0AAD4BE65_BOLED|nr:hypothetical protein L210DRAFT_384715 [Boletus edulis BED1]
MRKKELRTSLIISRRMAGRLWGMLRGTWQFMSANPLEQPGKFHTVTDDPESFLHVLGWMTLRYVPAIDSYYAEDRGEDALICTVQPTPSPHCCFTYALTT